MDVDNHPARKERERQLFVCVFLLLWSFLTVCRREVDIYIHSTRMPFVSPTLVATKLQKNSVYIRRPTSHGVLKHLPRGSVWATATYVIFEHNVLTFGETQS